MIAETLPIVIADDDPDDRALALEALVESHLLNPVVLVADGVELLDYLKRRGAYAAPGAAPRPGVILVDLNMPRLNGREAIAAIKADPELRRIPLVALTTSRDAQDVARAYELGVNSYIVKPVSFSGLIRVMTELGRYWFEIVELADVRDGP